MRRLIVAIAGAVALVLVGAAVAIGVGTGRAPVHVSSPRQSVTTIPTTTTTSSPALSVPAPPLPNSHAAASSGSVQLVGCPPPARPPGPPGHPWHPAVLVPDSALPIQGAPSLWSSNTSAILGKGMWVWQFAQTEGGNVDSIVRRATQTGLRQLWVRVGDSVDGFYAKNFLDALVPRAHAAGLFVIGWGFPYLYDPMGDAGWSARALGWQGMHGERLDGFSADLEMATEGVDLTERRAAVYLGAVRKAAGNRLVVATVYAPVGANWTERRYPFAAMAPYVDAFAPMVYWGCTDPGFAATEAVQRLSTLRPVHLIGQAYNMAADGAGRDAAPSPAEIQRFLATGQQVGALGASFWSWQSINAKEWNALATFPWAG